MTEGTRDFEKLESMIKEVDQKRETDSARIDATLNELKVMIQGLTVQNNDRRQQVNSQEGGGATRESSLDLSGAVSSDAVGQSGDGNPSFRYATKLEFPKFNGEGVDEWLFKVDQFFLLDKTLEQAKISVVALHLEESALHWHKNYIKLKGRIPMWGEYVSAMRARFGALAYEDPMAELKKLRQTGSLHDYLKSFEVLLDRAQLGEEQALSCFLAGLKHEMEMMVRMFHPKTLQEAYSLAKLQEAVKNGPASHGQIGEIGVYNKNQENSIIPQVAQLSSSGSDPDVIHQLVDNVSYHGQFSLRRP